MRRRKNFGNFSLILNPWLPGISRGLIQRGRREEAFMHVLESEVKPGMVALDLGANIGYTTMTMASIVNDMGTIYAIEPDPRNLDLLRRSIKLNQFESRVKVYQCAVSDRTGSDTFYMARKSNLSGIDRTDNTRKAKAIPMPLTTLDEFFSDKLLPQFIKMDIEGHEVEALRGFTSTISGSNFPLRVLMEVHPVMYDESRSLKRELETYFGAGFYCKYVISAGVARPEPFAALGYEPSRVFDIAGQYKRGLYLDISNHHAVDLACRLHDGAKVVRAILIERSGT